MKDYLFVSFFLGHTAGAEAKRLLRDCDLLEIAESAPANRHAWLGGLHRGVSLRLPADDGRLGRLLDQLTARQVDPLTRLDREFSQQELDRAEWLMVRVATAGLYGVSITGKSTTLRQRASRAVRAQRQCRHSSPSSEAWARRTSITWSTRDT